MKLLIKSSLILTTLFIVVCSFSTKEMVNDEAKILELLQKSKDFYVKHKHFKFTTNHSMYAGNTKQPLESYNGFFIKKNANYYSKIGDTEFVFSSGSTLKIDNESKLMQYINDESSKENLLYDLTSQMGNFGTFELKSTNDYWICTLNSREVTFIPYSKIIIYLSKKDYSIVKQELFLISQVKIKDEKGKDVYVYPKLQITFKDLTFSEQSEEYFKMTNYIEIKKGKYYPVKKYSSYQIVD